MASKSAQEGQTPQQIEELLDAVDLTLDRLKTLYEQYFMGIQKQAPAFIHNDVERKLRDLTQMNIRNTGLRYRLNTLSQKFGSYNSYWRRALRQIENGTYLRNLSKIGRDAARTGADIPEEILAAMPKRMREQVIRDRDAAIAIAKRRNQVSTDGAVSEDEMLTLADDPMPPEADEVAAMISEPSQLRRDLKTRSGAHVLSEADADVNFDEFFSAFQDDAPAAPPPKSTPMPTPAPGSAAPAPRPQYAKPGVPNLSGVRIRPTGSFPAPAAPTSEQPPAPHATEPRMTPVPGPRTPVPTIPTQRATGPVPVVAERGTGERPVVPAVTPPLPPQRATGPLPVNPSQRQTGSVPAVPGVPPKAPSPTGAVPRIPSPAGPSGPIPRVAPSQITRPNPIAPGSAAQTGPVAVESMSGPFPREKPAAPAAPKPPAPPAPRPPQPIAKPAAPAPQKPPPGMTDADVNALHAKYVQAKQMVGEKVDAGSREKLLKTINQTAPKIMEQYKASGVDFSVVVKDNQVIIKAKPKA